MNNILIFNDILKNDHQSTIVLIVSDS
jgi:hypothetical protein